MEIAICQACGFILRGKGKFCTGCGTYVSKYSPTVLPEMAQQNSAPLSLTLSPDPFLLERVLTRQRYHELNSGNGDKGGNGEVEGGPRVVQPTIAQPAPPTPPAPSPAPEPVVDFQPEAPPKVVQQAPTSRLGSVLGSASPFSRPQASPVSKILAFMDEEEPDQAPAPGPQPAAQPPTPQPVAPAAYAEPAAQQVVPPSNPAVFATPQQPVMPPLPVVPTGPVSVGMAQPVPAPAEPPASAPPTPVSEGWSVLGAPTQPAPAPAPAPTPVIEAQPPAEPLTGANAPAPQFSTLLKRGFSTGELRPAFLGGGISGSFIPPSIPEPEPALEPVAPAPGAYGEPGEPAPSFPAPAAADAVGQSWPATPADTSAPSSPASGMVGAPALPGGQNSVPSGPAPIAPGDPMSGALQVTPQTPPEPAAAPAQPAPPQPAPPEPAPSPAPTASPEPAPASTLPPATPAEPSSQAIPGPTSSLFGRPSLSGSWMPPASSKSPVDPASPADPVPPAPAPSAAMQQAMSATDILFGEPEPPLMPIVGAAFAPEPPAAPIPPEAPVVPAAPDLPAASAPAIPAETAPEAVPQVVPAATTAEPSPMQPPPGWTPLPTEGAAPAPAASQEPAGNDFFASGAPPSPQAQQAPPELAAPAAPRMATADFIPAGVPPATTASEAPSAGAGLFEAAPAPPPLPFEAAAAAAAPPPGFDAAPAAASGPGGLDFFAGPPGPTAGAAQTAPPPGSSPADQAFNPGGAPAAGGSGGGLDFFAVAPPATPTQDSGFMSSSAPMSSPYGDLEPSRSTGERGDRELDDGDGEFPDESTNRGQSREKKRSTRETDTEKEAAPADTGRKLRGMASREEETPSKPAETSDVMQKVYQYAPFLRGDIEVAGNKFPRTHAAIAAVVAAFIGLQVLGLVGNIVGGLMKGGGGAQAAKVPALAGKWELAFKTGPRDHHGYMMLQQSGSQLGGEGQDDAYFVINGNIDFSKTPPKVQFNKQYVVDQQPQGKPIVYSGELTFPKEGPYMSGVFIANVKKGVFLKAKVVQIRDRWEAAWIEPLGGAQSGAAPEPEVKPRDPIVKQQQTFVHIAGILLLLGCGLVWGSLQLFGPSGKINIWAKRKYIPSQFEAQHGKMIREMSKPAGPGSLPMGQRMEWNFLQFYMPKELAIPPDMRDANPHMLILGGGSKGKSRLMASMIAHDIQSNDRAVVVVDSDGALVELMTRWIASHPKGKEFAERVTIIDPTFKGGCPAYNPLEEPDDGDLQGAASALVFGFKAIYTEPPGSQSQWNQQTANILRNSALLLTVNGKTLVDLPTLLSDNDFRDILLEKVEKRKQEKVEFITLLETWGQYKRLARTDQWITWVEPILNRVSPMLSDPRIRPILTKAKADMSLKDIIREGKILLVKIPQGQLDQNANLLGSLIVTGLKRAAMSLAVNTSRKHKTSLYLDEFDNFIEKETIDSLTNETKKFQIGMIGAVKTLQHLPEDFRSQLVINVGTMFIFALAKKDGDMLGPQMFRVDGRKVKHQTMSNLFNKVNSSPQFELISDEEKLNIDRVVGQEEQTYFCYRVGTVAGVFHMKAPEFKDIPDKDVNWTLMDEMCANNVSEETK